MKVGQVGERVCCNNHNAKKFFWREYMLPWHLKRISRLIVMPFSVHPLLRYSRSEIGKEKNVPMKKHANKKRRNEAIIYILLRALKPQSKHKKANTKTATRLPFRARLSTFHRTLQSITGFLLERVRSICGKFNDKNARTGL